MVSHSTPEPQAVGLTLLAGTNDPGGVPGPFVRPAPQRSSAEGP